ncbi:MAG: MerR family transcriptional regulator [Prevotellaceae bacterium]|nr:MerR family transcriptional regulator [Prevotellaceae bacterium]
MALNKNKDLKMFYSISEVAQMFNVTETLLRYWEKEFPNIKPQKGGRGIRQYTKDDIKQVRLVHHLVKERGLTLQGARDMLKRNKKGDVNRQIEVIDRLKAVKAELQEIGKNLNGLV